MFRVGSFHGKVIASGDTGGSRVSAIFVGSMNLTGAALGSVPMNYEAALALTGRTLTRDLVNTFNAWWQRAWNESLDTSLTLIDAYARARESALENNPDLNQFVEASAKGVPEFGSNLWIESGAMSGGARNQIEFAADLVPFFGPVERASHKLRLRAQGQVWDDRPLSHKMTTLGVEIWRLSLPTELMGGPDYVDRVVRLQRAEDDVGLVFDLEVADSGSRAARRWTRASETQGHIGVTGGGREYGLW